MPIFRADLYIKISIADFDLTKSSNALFQFLQKISDLRNVQMTKVRINREEQGKIKIEEWFEISGSLNVPEGGKSFWVISKNSSKNEPYNFFMRIDRNIESLDYEDAQKKASEWVEQMLIQPIKTGLTIENYSINSPIELSKIALALGESK